MSPERIRAIRSGLVQPLTVLVYEIRARCDDGEIPVPGIVMQRQASFVAVSDPSKPQVRSGAVDSRHAPGLSHAWLGVLDSLDLDVRDNVRLEPRSRVLRSLPSRPPVNESRWHERDKSLPLLLLPHLNEQSSLSDHLISGKGLAPRRTVLVTALLGSDLSPANYSLFSGWAHGEAWALLDAVGRSADAPDPSGIGRTLRRPALTFDHYQFIAAIAARGFSDSVERAISYFGWASDRWAEQVRNAFRAIGKPPSVME